MSHSIDAAIAAVLGLGLAGHSTAPGREVVRDRGQGEIEWVARPGTAVKPPVPQGDPDLEPGFPVQSIHTAGSYRSGPAIHVLVANVDADRELEIVKTALASGPLYAWNHDGSLVSGWPTVAAGAVYPAWGVTQPSGPFGRWVRGVFAASYPGSLALLRSRSAPWDPAWPREAANYVSAPATMADLDGDGSDEILLEEEDWALHAYRGDGTIPPGWPVLTALSGQRRHTPAIANLDGVGGPEIVTVGEPVSNGTFLFAYHADGSVVPGFPVGSSLGYAGTYPAIGDVDGDGAEEIVTVEPVSTPAGFRAQVVVRSASGVLERTMLTGAHASYGSAPALADLTGDGSPEIVVQTDTTLEVFRGDGTSLPGWPRVLGTSLDHGNSAPVVGDVTGDGEPDIAITTQVGGSSTDGHVRLFHKTGEVVSGFPKALPLGSGAVPAIADVDLDGRNELVIGGSYWSGVSGVYDTVWVYDLHGASYGPVLWGQFMGGPRHQGRYVQP